MMRRSDLGGSDMPEIYVGSVGDADRLLDQIKASAKRVHDWIAVQSDPLDMLKRMKFETSGFHPIEDRALNVIEQINQTWTYAVAAVASRKLLDLHPEAGGFYLAPGAHASLALDIMSKVPGLVGAETFAAVDPRNNGKLNFDLQKLSTRGESFRYVFFMSPRYPHTARQPTLERGGVQVWSLDF